ncbi:MAG: PRC-barrel domain-containing protein [Nanoarchaeota archaeon]|nr:PRC-barrel domain-containing protein [Nanoarchaeota archaeon]
MADEEKKFGKQILGKTVVSKSGKKFGMVGDIIFEARTGELIHLVLTNPTEYTGRLELERDKESRMLIPFSSVIAVGDFVVVSEEDII